MTRPLPQNKPQITCSDALSENGYAAKGLSIRCQESDYYKVAHTTVKEQDADEVEL